MKIPKKINLLNKEIKIEIDKSLVSKDNHLGWADYSKNIIKLDGSKEWEGHIEETFLHELTHWILYSMEDELHKNEKFVSLFSCLLHQAFKSAKY